MRRGRMLVLAFAAVFALAACGGDEPETAAPTGGMDSTAPADGDAMQPTIAEIVAGDEDFSTLLAAVTEAELAETLASEGPFTVFAPTDDAFAALPDGTLETLLRPRNREQLASILTYHVVPGEVLATDVTPGEVMTVNGEAFTVSMGGMDVVLTDAMGNDVTVTQTDITASNGVVHVIDGVLLP